MDIDLGSPGAGGRMAARAREPRATVLLIEGEPVLRSGFTDLLGEAGFAVIEAGSSEEAWTVLETHPEVQVVFADLDAPAGADGLELARKLHQRWPDKGLVITSGHIRHLSPAAVPENGCFLPRPLPADILVQEITLAARHGADSAETSRSPKPYSWGGQ